MSSNLKAFKKPETEKEARQHDLPKTKRKTLHNNVTERSFLIKAILAAVFLFVCGGSVTYVYVMQDRELPSVSTTKAHNYPAPKTTLPSSSPMPVKVPVERIEPETIVGAPSEPDMTASPKTYPIAEKQRMTNSSFSSMPLQIPALRVNGIAFQDGVDSVAVVNGVPVSKGSLIEGVKVDEMQRDRVLFSYDGEKFYIQLGKSNH